MLELLKHYFSMPEFLFFLLISSAITVLIHLLLWARAKYSKNPSPFLFEVYKEEYYELIFASTSTLFFAGIYFLFEFRWFDAPDSIFRFWDKYDSFILLALLVISIVIINVLDRVIIPLRQIDMDTMGILRMTSMVYMLIIFAYIKFIYQDNNYDTIVIYFITMLIGRFVDMDASYKGFRHAYIGFIKTLPIMLCVLLSTGLLALYGFQSGYLLKSNGVVVSLCIAHIFVIVEIFIIVLINKIFNKKNNIVSLHDV